MTYRVVRYYSYNSKMISYVSAGEVYSEVLTLTSELLGGEILTFDVTLESVQVAMALKQYTGGLSDAAM